MSLSKFQICTVMPLELLIILISVIVVIITSPKSGFTTSSYALTSKDISDNNESFTKTPSSISILGSIDFTYPKLLCFCSEFFLIYHKLCF